MEPPTSRPPPALIPKEASESIYFFQLHHHHQCVSCPHPSPVTKLPSCTKPEALLWPPCLPTCSPALTPALLVDGIQASFKACRPTSSGTFPHSVSASNHPPSYLPNKPASFPSTIPCPQAFAHAVPFAHSLCPECSSQLSLVIQLSSPMPLSQSSSLIISCSPWTPNLLPSSCGIFFILGMVLLPARPDPLSPLLAPHIGSRCKTGTLRTP